MPTQMLQNQDSLQNLDWKDLINQDFPQFGPVTEESVNLAHEEQHRFRGSVRMSAGRVWTDAEYEEFRNSVLSKPLP